MCATNQIRKNITNTQDIASDKFRGCCKTECYVSNRNVLYCVYGNEMFWMWIIWCFFFFLLLFMLFCSLLLEGKKMSMKSFRYGVVSLVRHRSPLTLLSVLQYNLSFWYLVVCLCKMCIFFFFACNCIGMTTATWNESERDMNHLCAFVFVHNFLFVCMFLEKMFFCVCVWLTEWMVEKANECSVHIFHIL